MNLKLLHKSLRVAVDPPTITDLVNHNWVAGDGEVTYSYIIRGIIYESIYICVSVTL